MAEDLAYLLDVTLTHSTGLASDEDHITMAFANVTDPVTLPLAATIRSSIQEFFNTINGTGLSLAQRLQPFLSRVSDANRFDLYDISEHLDGSPHGTPVLSGLWSLDGTPPLPTGAPAEGEAVITLHGFGRDEAVVEVGGIRPKQRRTGRIYVGPIDGSSYTSSGSEYRWGAGMLSDLHEAASRFRNAMLDDANLLWSVWSREDATLYYIVATAVDNAPDTQRRRGVDPTVRTVNSVLAP